MHFQLGSLFFKYYSKIINLDTTLEDKTKQLYHLMDLVAQQVTKDENIPFTTLHARQSYVFFKFDFPENLKYFSNLFRRRVEDKTSFDEDLLALGTRLLAEFIAQISQCPIPEEISSNLADYPMVAPEREGAEKYDFLRVLVTDIVDNALVGTAEIDNKTYKIPYNLLNVNEAFTVSIRCLKAYCTLPMTVNLLDVVRIGSDTLHAKGFVLEPDFLMGVTSISGCFQKNKEVYLLSLLKKFLPKESSSTLMVGNIANHFLDELLIDDELDYNETIKGSFQLAPLEFSTWSDTLIKGIFNECKKHFSSIQQLVKQGLADVDIYKEDCFIEPSFYAPNYGIQGRLDLLYAPEAAEKSAILELKSGKKYTSGTIDINEDHYIQVLGYDLVTEGAIESSSEIKKFIFYSKLPQDNLKNTSVVQSEKDRVLNMRNMLIVLENMLARTNDTNYFCLHLLDKLNPIEYNFGGFLEKNIRQFSTDYKNFQSLQKKYFLSYVGFLAREFKLSKLNASRLWLDSPIVKVENYALLSFLEVTDLSEIKTASATLYLEKSAQSPELVNFRIGDRLVLYPERADKLPTDNQLYRCTLVEMDAKRVGIKLSAKQFNDTAFKKFKFWNLEKDILDSSFDRMYQSVFRLAAYPVQKQNKVLGLVKPAAPAPTENISFENTTEEQATILNKIIVSNDYFLLWGPPGTGKTSVMVRHLVDYYLNKTEEKILILAYTNRAVDELCEAVESVDPSIRDLYFRIGSKYSVAPRFREQLLNEKIRNLKNRQEVRDVLGKQRIVLATLSSFHSKTDLTALINFDRVIIDEASQIIEPLLVGILPSFKHYTLIGDHKQLPAVVVQPTQQSVVTDKGLKAIGLTNLRNSYFERFYNLLSKWGQSSNFGMLSAQGRMHKEIMAYSSQYFYDNKLDILPNGLNPKQEQALPEFQFQFDNTEIDASIGRMLNKRVAFLDVPSAEKGLSKTNTAEAKIIARLIEILIKQGGYTAEDIGVITPFRAQIAKIKGELEKKNLYCEAFLIDTVERFQGGAKNIILISLCINNPWQLDSLISHSDDGVDRKLNVALTRARERLLLLGDKKLLETDKNYQMFITTYQV